MQTSPGFCPGPITSSTTSRVSRTFHDRSLAKIPDGVAITLSKLHNGHASLSSVAQVTDLTFRLDQALIDICNLNAQLRKAQHVLQQAVENHTNETAVLLQQVRELREACIRFKYSS